MIARIPFLRHAAVFSAVLLGGCHAKPADYHEAVAHPFLIVENSVALDLGQTGAGLGARTAAFAAGRPNAGSSFVVRADAAAAPVILRALAAQGIPPGDIQIITAETPSITRTDRIATVEGCDAVARPVFAPQTLDDGYGHSNADGLLLGCSVRRNIAAMTADPRTLVAADPFSGRSGARGADVYGKWSKGQPTQASGDISAAATSAVPTIAPAGKP